MINNRQGQAGRRRGRGGNNPGPRQGNPGRPDNGNRIDSRARGNASQLYEKYKTLASDMQRQGDRVTTEYYLQFADHYFRVLSEQRGRADEQQPRRQRDDFDFDGSDGMGDEFGDEGEPVRAKEQWGEQGEGGGQGQPSRYEQARDERPREDRQRDERPREDRQRDERPREDRQRDERPRDERPREDQQRGDRSRDDRPDRQRDDQPRADRQRDGQFNGRGAQRDGQRDRQRESQADDAERDGNRRDVGEQRPPREWQERGDRDSRRPPRADADQSRGTESQPVEVAGQRRAEPLNANQSLEDRAEAVLEADRPLDPPAPRRRGRPRREDTNGASALPAADDGNGAVFQADLLPPSITLAANDAATAEPKPRRRRARPAEGTPDAAE